MKNNIQLSQFRHKNFLSKTIMYMLFLFIPIDMLNGFMLTNGYPSISLFLKALVIFLILIFLTRENKYLYIFLIPSILLTFTLTHLLITNDLRESIKGLDWMIKFIGITAYFMFFRQLLLTKHSENIFLFTKLSFIFLVINFILAILGFGYPMYAAEYIGYKGFIYAGNEVGTSIIVSGGIMLMYALNEKNYIKFSLIGLAMLIIAALITSKVSIFGGLLIIFIFTFISFIKQITNFKIAKKSFIFTSIVIVTLPMLFMGVLYYALFVSNLIERLSYHYDEIDLITLIFSHRNIWAAEAWNAYLNHYTLIEQLFGTSKEWYIYITGEKLVEIDPIDFLMTYGLFGFLLVTSFLSYIFTLLFTNRQNNPYFSYLLFTYSLVLSFSLTSGHIMNSGIAGALIGALFALSSFQKNIGEKTYE